MKATLVLTTLLGLAVANPVAIANNAEKRDVKLVARQAQIPNINGVTSSTPLSSFSGVSGLSSLSLLGVPSGINKDSFIPALLQILSGILGITQHLRSGLPGGSGISMPPVPALPGLPSTSSLIPSGSITPDQFGGLLAALQVLIQSLIGNIGNMPAGLSTGQLQQAMIMVTSAQSQLSSLFGPTGLPSLSNLPIPSGGIPIIGSGLPTTGSGLPTTGSGLPTTGGGLPTTGLPNVGSVPSFGNGLANLGVLSNIIPVLAPLIATISNALAPATAGLLTPVTGLVKGLLGGGNC